ncbi:phosphoadenosine phosphosulfate reductase domain-containing protein [Candidatus Methanoperedens nitratireducens]|uniref:Phosphoadenosine phosphosulfate reductase fused to RNA-binding PUA and 4Fe-4S binding domains n=1 Tax=Candidatus Methanoperedens nitratireducens TaxID=1392998 RepID=A0A284VKF7_9EURY|nr:phosphoadenosine phosphosulfate reductase family protein [Candidatus Methanoperedens nitroreducens]SNQ59776.1 Phosphoadenosine phosphosulfate reductase fused to RNA-binding PUA and 4Fe-4S binding domains [Candidatus Methanoperedens nitroreducens]
MTHYLGELLLYWCRSCNLPVLGKTCACGAGTKKIDITPPGDVRPAFRYDIDLINRTTEKQFGLKIIPEGGLVVLNKAPYEDRMDEVIFDGAVMGSLRFELERMDWVFIPRLEGARRLVGGRKWVVVDKGAIDFIIKGASVLAPGVNEAEASIVEDDEVIVLTPQGEIIATGRARMNAERMLTHEKGMAVKTRWNGKPQLIEQTNAGVKRTWDDAVIANMQILKKLEEKAHRFIRNVVETTGKPVTISYSGGKDSLATLLLVRDAAAGFDILFADTGLEFQETLDNVKQVAEELGLPLKSHSSGDSFWQSIDNFGPPTVEARWCCKVCKLGAITRLIEGSYEDGCLTFIGQRKYESEIRANSEHIWRNPWVGNQIGATPIQNWTALHVWLYLFWKKARYNPLYEEGFDRIGCWLCPSASMADFSRLKEIHPELNEKLEKYLLGYASRSGLPEQWVTYGFWRWQVLPKSIRMLAEKMGIDIAPKYAKKPVNFTMTAGYRPCKTGGVTAEGSFGAPLALSLIEDTGFMGVIGSTNSIDGVILAQRGEETVHVYASGTVVARGGDEENARKLIELAEKTIRRALSCTGCGVCVGQCASHAISVNGTARVNQKCTRCGKCTRACPVVKFG